MDIKRLLRYDISLEGPEIEKLLKLNIVTRRQQSG